MCFCVPGGYLEGLVFAWTDGLMGMVREDLLMLESPLWCLHQESAPCVSSYSFSDGTLLLL